jgi:methyl-accepting chemotaxis protein
VIIMPALTIQRKTIIAALSVLMLCALSSGTGMWVALKLSAGIDRAVDSGQIMRTHMGADMMHDALRGDVYAAIISADPATGLTLEDAEKDFQEHKAEFEKLITENEAADLPSQTRGLLAKVKIPLQDYVAGARAIIALAGTDAEAAKEQLPRFAELFKQLETAMEEVSDSVTNAAMSDAAEAKADAKLAKWIMAGLLALGLVFALALTILAQTGIVRPIEKITSALDRLASGDLSTKVPDLKTDDEIGRMARALRIFREEMQGRQSEVEARKARDAADEECVRHEAVLRAQEEERRMVVASLGQALEELSAGNLAFRIAADFPAEYRKLRDDFNGAIFKLEDVVRTIARASENTRLGTGEISSSTDELAQRTSSQAASLEQVVAALQDMTSTFRTTAQGAADARAAVGSVRDEAGASGDVVARAVEAMSAIHQSANEVSKIIVVIDEIAFQTSLLALNAGVEAARAGDAGRGFAVVAQEVRALAQRSAESAKEIKGLISASTQQVDMGVSLVGETGEALNRMAGKVGEIDALVSRIAGAARDQAARLAEINSSANQMDHATRQNAAMAEEMTEVSRNLASDARELAEMVGRFEVSREDTRDWRMAG